MEGRDMPQDAQGIFTAGPLSFVVKHELWDENIQDHADQGVAICVTADVTGGRTIRTLDAKLPKMLKRAGYPAIAKTVEMSEVRQVLPEVEACAQQLYATKRNTVKHNRGTHIFEAGNIRFGLEMRRLPMGDGGLAIHVLADVGGTPGKKYTEETELLAFDHFWNGAHYHYGPRNK